jgi:hypothetical protein
MAGKGVLHAPHFPVSERCFAGIRFVFPQDGQFRMTGMANSSIEPPRQQYLAGQAIATTARSVRELGQIVGQVAAAPAERSAAVEKVNIAVAGATL